MVVESESDLKAKKIEKIEAKLGPVTDHVFKDKVVKQGVIIKQIIFVDPVISSVMPRRDSLYDQCYDSGAQTR